MASTKQYFSAAGKPIRCKAAVARKAGEPLVIEEVIVAPPKAHEVRLKIICTSLCHTDITLWKLKEFPGCFPRILGHEAFGVVESVGEDVDELKEGDSVVPIFLPDCMDKSKKSNLCSKFPFQVSPLLHRDDTSRFSNAEEETLHHFLYISSFSEYTVVDVVNVTKIDPEIPPYRACLLSCGVSTGVGAARKTANVEPGSTVVIFGLGSIGLAVAEGARLCGATRIIGVDINSNKFEIGKQFGITEFVNSKSCVDKPISQVIIEMTDGGADYCFECVGLATLVQEAFTCCRKELQLNKFVTHEVNFEDINKAFDLLIQGKSLLSRTFRIGQYSVRHLTVYSRFLHDLVDSSKPSSIWIAKRTLERENKDRFGRMD